MISVAVAEVWTCIVLCVHVNSGAWESKWCPADRLFMPSSSTGRTLAFPASPRWVEYLKCPAVFCLSSLSWLEWVFEPPVRTRGNGVGLGTWGLMLLFVPKLRVKEVIFEEKNSESHASIACTGRSEFSLLCLWIIRAQKSNSVCPTGVSEVSFLCDTYETELTDLWLHCLL